MSGYTLYAASWLDNRLPAWVGRMVRSKEWRQSTALSITVWLVSTFVVFELIERQGCGWQVKVVVALCVDGLMYIASKVGIWRKRHVGYARSYGFWLAWWCGFLVINTLLAWVLLDASGIGTLLALGILGIIGIAMNPIVYTFRNKVVFRDACSETKST